MTEVTRYQIYLNSEQRTSGTSEYFTVLLNRPLQLKSDTNYFQVCVTSACIPFSFKQVNSTNNTCGCSATISGVTHSFYLTIPSGNYQADVFIGVFRSQIMASILSLFSITLDLSCSYDQTIGRFKIMCNTPNVLININSTTADLGKFFGYHNYWSFSSGVLNISAHHCNMSPARSLFIRSDKMKLNAVEALLEPNTPSDIIARVPITSGYNSWIQYEGSAFSQISDKIINEISLYISPDNAYTIDLDGIDLYVGLTFIEIAPNITPIQTSVAPIPVGPTAQPVQPNDPTLPVSEATSSIPDSTQDAPESDAPPESKAPPESEAGDLYSQLEDYKKQLENLQNAKEELNANDGH